MAATMNREDQEKVRVLLTEAVRVLCRNGLTFNSHVNIDGLLGVTMDNTDVFLVKICETVAHGEDSSEFSQVAQLLGAAKSNYGLSIASVSSAGSPLPLSTYNLQTGKDHNDNHPPGVITIAPTSGRSLLSTRTTTVGNKRRLTDKGTSDEPQEKRAMHTNRTSEEGWELAKDNGEEMDIKSEPYDSEEEQQQPAYGRMKTLGVISTVKSDAHSSGDSCDEESSSTFSNQQGDSQDGVLAALRAALIHKLANSGTPASSKYSSNNNNNNTTSKQSPAYAPRKGRTSGGSGTSSKDGTPDNWVTLKCLMCTYETKRRYNFIRHMRGHSKSFAIYACDLCGDRFHSEEELGTHGLEAHKGHHLTCDQCGMTFMSERGKNIHAKTHKMMPIPDKKPMVECEVQCNDHEMEETMARHGAMEPAGTDDGGKPYSALRSQLTSSSMVLRYPVLNGHSKRHVPSADADDDDTDSDSKACGTSTETEPTGTQDDTSKNTDNAQKKTKESSAGKDDDDDEEEEEEAGDEPIDATISKATDSQSTDSPAVLLRAKRVIKSPNTSTASANESTPKNVRITRAGRVVKISAAALGSVVTTTVAAAPKETSSTSISTSTPAKPSVLKAATEKPTGYTSILPAALRVSTGSSAKSSPVALTTKSSPVPLLTAKSSAVALTTKSSPVALAAKSSAVALTAKSSPVALTAKSSPAALTVVSPGTPSTSTVPATTDTSATAIPLLRKEKSRKQDSTQIIRVVPVAPVKAEPEDTA